MEDGRQQAVTAQTSARNRISLLDMLVAIGGVGILVGLALQWGGATGGSGFESISLLRVLLILVAVVGIALPVVLSVTQKTDVPVIWEALLAPIASILLVIVAFKLAFPPEGGAGIGMFVTGLGLLILSISCWKALSRET